MTNHIRNSDDSNFDITSKRRKGFPSETSVKRGERIVHGRRRSFSKGSAATTSVRAVQDAAFKKCCLRSGRYDGAKRHHFFPRVIARSALAVRQHFLRAEGLGLSLKLTAPRSPTCPQFQYTNPRRELATHVTKGSYDH
jgi:hypothetical protein